MSLRSELAEAINDDRHSSYRSYVDPGDIVTAEFRKGCAEIDVTYHVTNGDDYEYHDTTTVDAAPILTALLAWAMNTEVTHED